MWKEKGVKTRGGGGELLPTNANSLPKTTGARTKKAARLVRWISWEAFVERTREKDKSRESVAEKSTTPL